MDTDKYKELLSAAINAFYKAKTDNKKSEKLYYKGLSEGMMKIVREADILSSYDLDGIINDAKLLYATNLKKLKGQDLSDIDIPTFVREGKDIRHYLI